MLIFPKLQSVDDRAWTTIYDWKPGAWQQHAPYNTEKSVLAYPTVFACQTLIASDIAKLKTLIQRSRGAIWANAVHPVNDLLQRPNAYQNSMQFKESWILSKLSHGNAYIFKIQTGNQVHETHVLDPLKTTPLVSDSGEVFYRLNQDRLKKVVNLDDGDIVVPATEIIHDRFNTLYHPLVGLSPIFAAGASATIGLTNQTNTKHFFANGSNPGGVLTAPGAISDATAKRLKEYWNSNFKGEKAGDIAVAGDGLKFESMRMSNVDAQVLELLGWNDQKICSVYHVPPYIVGVGALPSYNNIEALSQAYYSQCLQILIEAMEMSLDVGLYLDREYRTQLDVVRGLFRMDTNTLMKTLGEGVGRGILSPDEAREDLNLAPVEGGGAPYLQVQNYSLQALAERDKTNPLVVQPEPMPEQESVEDDNDDENKLFGYLLEKALADV